MPNWKKSAPTPERVGILLFDGFSNHCLANTVEPMRAANTLAGRVLYRWQFLSPDGKGVRSSSGLEVAVGGRLGTEGSGDWLAVMPSYGHLRHATYATASALRAATRRYGILAGLDTGAWLMAEAGLLDGRRATIHPDEFEAFAERFPDVRAERARVVTDGDRITCAGAAAAYDLMDLLIGQTHGRALAIDVAALFMRGDPAPGGGPMSRFVARALALMQDNVETPLALPVLARRLGRSQKALEQAFATELGATPRAAYRRLRLNGARRLVETGDLSVAEIALRSGYADAAAFTRAFRREFGASPRALRQSAPAVRPPG